MPQRLTISPRTSRVRLALLIVVLCLAVALIGIGIYGLVRGPARGAPAPSSAAPSTTQSDTPAPAPTVSPLPDTTDPKTFAHAAALALFNWDTTTGLQVADYEHPLIVDADPTGQNTPGLLEDLTAYFPTADEWDQLRNYQTRQWLSITSLAIPSDWQAAVRASHGQIQDGVIGYTVTGTRHRAGVWTGKPVTSSQQVSFTMFLACPPATKQCALLRLSELDNPLH